MTRAAGEVNVFDGIEDMTRAAAERFVAIARAALSASGRFTLALTGGHTAGSLYRLLASPGFIDWIDWSRVALFWGDERPVPPTHPDSNFKLVRDTLLRTARPLPQDVHRMPAERPDRDQAATEYANEIAIHFGVRAGEPPPAPPPAFDLILLGLGADSHCASLFPHTEALAEKDRWVVCNWVPELGSYRMTFTFPILKRGSQLMFIVSGLEKAAAVRAVLEGPYDPDTYPAQRIQPESGRLVWFIDRGAASLLS